MNEHAIVSRSRNQVQVRSLNRIQDDDREYRQHQQYHQHRRNENTALDNRHVALVDLLDRILAGGVVAMGDIELSIADVPLVRISLRAVIASVSTLANETTNELIDEHPRDARGQRR